LVISFWLISLGTNVISTLVCGLLNSSSSHVLLHIARLLYFWPLAKKRSLEMRTQNFLVLL